MKELGEESREGAELSVAEVPLSQGFSEAHGHTQLHGGLLGWCFRRYRAKGWTGRISTHRSHWYSQLPMTLVFALHFPCSGEQGEVISG